MAAHRMGVVKTDLNGKGQFPGVAPGTYFGFGAVLSEGKALVWNLKVELKAGNNSVVLDQRNATLEH